MFIRTPADLGAIIRDSRKRKGLDQAELATRIGVSRQWVIGVERGRARVELALVLRALDALDICLDAQPKVPDSVSPDRPNIDDIVARARKEPS